MVSLPPQTLALMQLADGRQPPYRQESLVELSKGAPRALLGLLPVSHATLAPTLVSVQRRKTTLWRRQDERQR